MAGIIMIAVWFGFGIWAGVIARKKGRSFAVWFVIGLVIGIFGVLIAWAVRPSTAGIARNNLAAGLAKCRECKAWIDDDARRCQHCGAIRTAE